MERFVQDILDIAKSIAGAGPNTSYPSRASAQYVRDVMQKLVARLESAKDEAFEEAAKVVDQCNRDGPYNAIGAASLIRALKTDAAVSAKPKESDMGNWNISINGTGAHHNQDNPGDANKRFQEFVKKLKEDGHSIQAATFTSGSRETAQD